MAIPFTSSIRAVTLGFGNLFNQIQVIRFDEFGDEAERFLVPIQYSNKEKYLARLQGDPNLDRSVQVTLPAMSFEMTGLTYDASRKKITNVKNFTKDSNGSIQSQYNPVPYNISFNLYIYTRNEEDGVQIIERILPFFTPDYTIKVNMVPFLGTVKDIPIVLDNIGYDSGYTGNYTSETRNIIWTLSFTVKTYMFGALNEVGLIKTAKTNIISAISDTDNVSFNMSQPGIGNYQVGETVYQGYSLKTAVATAQVTSWANGILGVTNLNGDFSTGSPIVGVITNASYNFASYSMSGSIPSSYVEIGTEPNPITANVGDLYTYATTIQETDGPVVIVGNANNEIVYAPPPPEPFNFNDLDLLQ
jgi:T4-like virus Myoviridae tail sheath stabiliser